MSTNATEEGQPSFPPGTYVRIRGLVSAPRYNGKIGIARSFDKGRYKVEISPKKMLGVRPGNLEHLCSGGVLYDQRAQREQHLAECEAIRDSIAHINEYDWYPEPRMTSYRDVWLPRVSNFIRTWGDANLPEDIRRSFIEVQTGVDRYFRQRNRGPAEGADRNEEQNDSERAAGANEGIKKEKDDANEDAKNEGGNGQEGGNGPAAGNGLPHIRFRRSLNATVHDHIEPEVARTMLIEWRDIGVPGNFIHRGRTWTTHPGSQAAHSEWGDLSDGDNDGTNDVIMDYLQRHSTSLASNNFDICPAMG